MRLVQQLRDRDLEPEREQRGDDGVVREHACRPRHPAPGQRLDARMHRRAEDDGDDEQRDDDPQLPQRERAREHADRDRGRHQHA